MSEIIANTSTIKELERYTIGALRGSFYSKGFNSNNKLKKHYANDTKQLIRMLKAGRVDIVIASSAHDLEQFERLEGVKLVLYQDNFYNGRYLSIPKSSSKHKYFEAFKSEIIRMVKWGEIDAIYTSYGLKPTAQKPKS